MAKKKNLYSQKEAKKYYLDIYLNKSIYVWGFNFPTIINQDSIDKAYKDYKSSVYNRAYYDKKLKEGDGKFGTDCSGEHYGLSGYDKTAQAYYNEVPDDRKGTIDTLPIHSCVILYKGKSAKSIKHTGAYLGDGMCEHAKSSASNCVYESVDKHGWTHWAYAPWIDYNTTLDDPVILTRLIKIGSKGIDVKLLQDRLNELKYDCGKVDGDFGNKTYKAVKKFQAANNLKVDGEVGKNTAKALGFKWKG